MSEYKYVVIETIENIGEPSRQSIRARPVQGQGFDTTLRVECSVGMREDHPIGTKFIVECTLTDREGTLFLYRHFTWDYEVVSDKEAEAFIREHYGDNET